MSLGGGNYITLSANADVNSLEVGKWYFKGSGISLTNFPFSGAYLFWTSYNISGSPTTFKHQYAYSLTDSAVYHRNDWGGGLTDWVRLDNFGCSTPETLASLLGAMPYKGDMNSLQDADSITTTCWKYLWDNTDGLQPLMTIIEGQRGFQIYIHNRSHIKFRYHWSTYWTEWFTLL